MPTCSSLWTWTYLTLDGGTSSRVSKTTEEVWVKVGVWFWVWHQVIGMFHLHIPTMHKKISMHFENDRFVVSFMCFATNVTWTEGAGAAIKRQRHVPHTLWNLKNDLNPSLNHEEKTKCKFLSASKTQVTFHPNQSRLLWLKNSFRASERCVGNTLLTQWHDRTV